MDSYPLNISDLQLRLRKFASEREWEQFHSPKNLAMALSVEAAELLEIFQWLTAEESESVANNQDIKPKAEQEIADIILYLLRIADLLQIDIADACENKLRLNAEKYPIDLARGNAKKYTELEKE